MNIFEYASRQKLRFASARGLLATEQLWDLPLLSRDSFDLDNVAKTINAGLKGLDEESFVSTKSSPRKKPLEISLEIVKFIIAVKLEAQEASRKREERNAERERLISALADKEHQAIRDMSPEAIKKRLAELDEEIPQNA